MYIVFGDMYGNYIYDSIVNDTKEISDDLYKNIKLGNFEENSIQEEYKELKEAGFFNGKKHEIFYPILEYSNSLLDRMLSKITIQVTQECNFRCKYCGFTENDGNGRLHSSAKMEWKVMEKTLDFFYAHSIDSKHLTIGFYGGEPFLNFRVIKKAIEYAENIFEGKPILFPITTNATLLTEEILEFLSKRDVALTISLDGPKELNDKNRVFFKKKDSTFEAVKEKILLIIKKYPKLLKYLSVNMVLDPIEPYSEYVKIYNEIPELHRIRVQASVVSDDGLKKEHLFSEKFIEESEYAKFINRISKKGKIYCDEKINQSNIMKETFNQGIRQMKRMIGRSIYNPAPAGPCIPGYNKLFVDVNGKFFPCEKVSEIVEDLCFGNIETGINYKKIEKLVKLSSITKEECEECWCFNLCASCVKYCTNSNGISRVERLRFCENVKNSALNILYDYVSMKKFSQ